MLFFENLNYFEDLIFEWIFYFFNNLEFFQYFEKFWLSKLQITKNQMVAKKRNEKTYTTLLLWRSRSKRAKSVPKGIESFCESWTKPYGTLFTTIRAKSVPMGIESLWVLDQALRDIIYDDTFFSKVLWFFFQIFFEFFFRKYVSRQPKLLKLRYSVDDGKLNEDTMAKKQKSEEKKKTHTSVRPSRCAAGKKAVSSNLKRPLKSLLNFC